MKNTKSLTSVILAVSRSNGKENIMDSQNKSVVCHKYFWLFAIVAVAFWSTAATSALADTNDQISEADNWLLNPPSTSYFYGELDVSTDVDMFKINVSAGQRIAFDIDERGGSNIDSYLRLFNQSGTQLSYNDDGAAPGEPSTYESYLEYTFSSSGSYYIGVSGYGNSSYNPITGGGDSSGETGMYTIYATDITPEPSKPDLAPYKFSNWDDTIVVSSTSGTHSDETIYVNQTAYIDYSFANFSTEADAPSGSYVEIWDDTTGQLVWRQQQGVLSANTGFGRSDHEWIFTQNGLHTIRMKVDADDDIDEGSNENNNEYTRYVYVNMSPAQPEILSVDCPGSITEGDWADIDVAVKNIGGSSPEGGISLSIPSFTGSTDDQLIYDDGSSSGTSEYYTDPEKVQGSTIYDKNGNPITASYLLAEFVDNNWQSDEINYLRVKVKPKSTGTFTFYVRSAMQTTGGDWINTPQSSSTTDQQSWPVNTYSIQVDPAPFDDAAVITFNPPIGLLQRGTQATTTVRVRNTGTTTRDFWVGLSFAHESATNAGWPYGWYDIYPIQTDSLQPNEEQLVTFEFTIPETLQAGQYYAVSAIWDGFDVSRHQMSGERFDDTRNYPPWSDVETGETSFLLHPFALSQDNQTIVDQLKYILGLSEFIGTLEDSYRMGDEAEKPLLAIGASIPASIAGVPVSVGGSILIDLADLCEVTPEGKDGWVTVWVAGEEGMTIGGSLLPMGVVRHGFSFRERGFADYRSSILAAGEVTIPGFVFTAAYYDEYDGWHGPRLEWNGQLAISFSVLNGKFGSLASREINRQIILDALIDAATLGIDLDSYVIDLIDLLAAIPSSGYRDITYDDGDWKLNPSQWEANLKMRRLWDNPFDFSNYFYVDVPENTSELGIVTTGGTGNANLHIRYGQRPDGLYHEGEYTYGSNNSDNEESITISNPPSGKFYLMLAAITEYDGVNLVANLTTATPILGDITDDGKVDFADLSRLANKWLWTGTPGSIDEDIAPQPNSDGIVNFFDFAVLAGNWLAGVE